MHAPITKAIFPVAGLGTRFLPATKANPKEMLPIVDKPLIQYAVDEAVSAGITDLIFVTSSSKRAIEDHFDKDHELERLLLEQGKLDLLQVVQNIVPKGINCFYVRQSKALGLGHAVLCARQMIGKEPVAILLADDLIHNPKQSCLQQMLQVYQQTGHSVIAVEEIPNKDSDKYGIIAVDNSWKGQGPIQAIIEKPKPAQAPSNFAVAGRYLLTPAIFDYLDKIPSGRNGEIQLTDAIAALLQTESVQALAFKGQRFDCGSKLGYLQAITTMALSHPELGQAFQQFLNNLVEQPAEID